MSYRLRFFMVYLEMACVNAWVAYNAIKADSEMPISVFLKEVEDGLDAAAV